MALCHGQHINCFFSVKTCILICSKVERDPYFHVVRLATLRFRFNGICKYCTKIGDARKLGNTVHYVLSSGLLTLRISHNSMQQIIKLTYSSLVLSFIWINHKLFNVYNFISMLKWILKIKTGWSNCDISRSKQNYNTWIKNS